MPRAATSEASRILGFFRTAALETAVLVLGLVSDVVRERKAGAAAAPAKPKQRRARRAKPAPVPAAAPPVNEAVPLAEQPTARKRRARKPAAAPPDTLALDTEGAAPAPGEYGSVEDQ